MRKATITEAKNQLSASIDRVRNGETIVITDRGLPVARLVPAVGTAAEDRDARLARLERRGGHGWQPLRASDFVPQNAPSMQAFRRTRRSPE
jgi:prevent-host-death family protein